MLTNAYDSVAVRGSEVLATVPLRSSSSWMLLLPCPNPRTSPFNKPLLSEWARRYDFDFSISILFLLLVNRSPLGEYLLKTCQTACLGIFNGLAIDIPDVKNLPAEKDEWVVILGGASSVGKYAVQVCYAS